MTQGGGWGGGSGGWGDGGSGGYGPPPGGGGGGGYPPPGGAGAPPGGGYPPPGGGAPPPAGGAYAPPGGGFGGPPAGGFGAPPPAWGAPGLVQAQPADLAGYSDKDQSTLFLLSVFAGTLGLDRFYLGQTGLGIAKLLTCGGFGIWAMVDMIMAGAGGLRDAQGRMLRPAAMVGSPTKSQGTAFLLAYFGGTLGLDRFYLGQTGLGVAKLLTCGGLGIWALIDLVLIGLGKLPDAQGNSLRPGF